MNTASILVVEDESIVAMDIQNMLELLGYAVPGVVSTGMEAIRKTAELRPDLVLMDIRLRGDMDGIEAAGQIRTRFQVPIIYLTAYADDEAVQRARLTEPFGYILKPFEEKELHVMIEMALYKSRMERALRASEQRFATTLKSIGDAVIVADVTGRITFMNAVAEQLTQWNQAEGIGKLLTEVLHIIDEETGIHAEDPITRALQQDTVVGLIGRPLLRARDGTTIPIDDSAAPIRDNWGNLTGGVLVFRDITERRQAELQRLAIERKLLETQKLESLGLLAGGIAHDFNNLLVAILGNADLALLDLETDSPARTSIDRIIIGARRAAELTRQMLAYAGKGRMEMQLLDLNTLITEMTTLMQISIPKSATITYQLTSQLPAVKADAIQIHQIIMNLVVNAAEALGESFGTITITTGLMPATRAFLDETQLGGNLPEGQYVYLEIADTGSGMDADTQQKIFDPFFTTKFTGRGLGLAAVMGIVREHQGTLRVSSTPGQGTSFRVFFPCQTDTATPPAVEPSLTLGKTSNSVVLIIDDEDQVRMVTAQMLQRSGYDVLTANDGSDGIELFQHYAGAITCVLLDMTMPGVSGEAVFRAIRRIKSDARILLISGHSEQTVVSHFVEQQRVRFLQKPFTSQTLLQQVQQLQEDA
jgi:two-component system, cell cycle sensor histidine kinase and response regulator CckA